MGRAGPGADASAVRGTATMVVVVAAAAAKPAKERRGESLEIQGIESGADSFSFS